MAVVFVERVFALDHDSIKKDSECVHHDERERGEDDADLGASYKRKVCQPIAQKHHTDISEQSSWLCLDNRIEYRKDSDYQANRRDVVVEC